MQLLKQAEALYEQGLAIHRELGDAPGMVSVLHILGSIARKGGDRERARQLYEESLCLFQGNSDKRGIEPVTTGLAVL